MLRGSEMKNAGWKPAFGGGETVVCPLLSSIVRALL